jgi:hypothetical protein
MVGVVSAVTGRAPLVTGKPDPAMHAECVRRTGARRPLVVGDRLDTDIEGARRAGADSLLVLTGVTDAAALLAAGRHQRPDLLSVDAGGLLTPHPAVVADVGGARCGSWSARHTEAADVLLLGVDDTDPYDTDPDDGDGLDGLRALCVAHWSRHPDHGAPVRVVCGDDVAAAALERWGLTGPA